MANVIAGMITIVAAILTWRCISVLRQDVIKENTRLRAAIAPLLRHADAPDTAPPLRLSVQDCREIVRKVDGC